MTDWAGLEDRERCCAAARRMTAAAAAGGSALRSWGRALRYLCARYGRAARSVLVMTSLILPQRTSVSMPCREEGEGGARSLTD